MLTIDDNGGYLSFLQPSSTVEVQGVVGSYQYHRPTNGKEALVNVVPVGGSLGKGFCTVRHELSLEGPPSATESSVIYRVRDRGYLEPCSTAQGKILSPMLVASAGATLECPRAKEPWYRPLS